VCHYVCLLFLHGLNYYLCTSDKSEGSATSNVRLSPDQYAEPVVLVLYRALPDAALAQPAEVEGEEGINVDGADDAVLDRGVEQLRTDVLEDGGGDEAGRQTKESCETLGGWSAQAVDV
jgi:hypothetical protein